MSILDSTSNDQTLVPGGRHFPIYPAVWLSDIV